jgi:hypothetical protein
MAPFSRRWSAPVRQAVRRALYGKAAAVFRARHVPIHHAGRSRLGVATMVLYRKARKLNWLQNDEKPGCFTVKRRPWVDCSSTGCHRCFTVKHPCKSACAGRARASDRTMLRPLGPLSARPPDIQPVSRRRAGGDPSTQRALYGKAPWLQPMAGNETVGHARVA